jgi:ABC-2 type transport system ATP-binding protein
MITVENLTRRYGRTTAIDDISFEVRRGDIVGFLGPNGAGKTTTMRILAGFLPPTGGRVCVAGVDVVRDSLAARRHVGYMPENVPLYSEMYVEEYLRYRGRLKQMHGRRLRIRVAQMLEECGLLEVRRKLIGALSKGFRQRVGLADSLLHEPELLILDEPTIGLDPHQIRHIRNLIRGLSSRHTVLLSSHILSEVEAICRNVIIINRGRILASDSTENLVGVLQGFGQVSVDVEGPWEKVAAALGELPHVIRVAHERPGAWTRFLMHCDKGCDIRAEIFDCISRAGWRLRELRQDRRNLEDIFVEMTGAVNPDERPGSVPDKEIGETYW